MPPSADFRPLFGLANPHVQTVLAVYCKSKAFPYPVVRRRVRLADGDQLVLHDTQPATWQATDPLAVVVHGLSGSHRSGAIVRMARGLVRRGVRAVRIDLRGTGAGIRLARGSYNAGCSDDLRAAVESMHRLAPHAPVWLAGVSLGANVILKLAGEAAKRQVPNLARVAVVAPPVDLDACVELLEHPRNRFYEKHFLGELLREARVRSRCFPDPPLPVFPNPLSLRHFDDLHTAPRAGYRDAADYYARASSNQFVPHIAVPTLILAAKDDPFVDCRPIERLAAPACVDVCITARGGHVGYLGADGSGGICWSEEAIVDWLTESA